MNTLYTYGCSFTQGMWEYDNTQTGKGEVKLKQKTIAIEYGTKENWGTQLAKDLNLEYVNAGFEGSGPLYSISQIQKDLANYKKGDLVILQLSIWIENFRSKSLKSTTFTTNCRNLRKNTRMD